MRTTKYEITGSVMKGTKEWPIARTSNIKNGDCGYSGINPPLIVDTLNITPLLTRDKVYHQRKCQTLRFRGSMPKNLEALNSLLFNTYSIRHQARCAVSASIAPELMSCSQSQSYMAPCLGITEGLHGEPERRTSRRDYTASYRKYRDFIRLLGIMHDAMILRAPSQGVPAAMTSQS